MCSRGELLLRTWSAKSEPTCKMCGEKQQPKNPIASATGLCKRHLEEMAQERAVLQARVAPIITKPADLFFLFAQLHVFFAQHLDGPDKGLAFYQHFAHFLMIQHWAPHVQVPDGRTPMSLASEWVNLAPQMLLGVGYATKHLIGLSPGEQKLMDKAERCLQEWSFAAFKNECLRFKLFLEQTGCCLN